MPSHACLGTMASVSLLRTTLRVAGKSSLAAATGGAAYGAYLYETDEGFVRMVQAYSTFIPVVIHYRWAEFRQDKLGQTVDWEAMDDYYASHTVSKLGELQGMYCKYGQTAAGFTNTFGDAWIKEFRKLENEVPPRSVEVVQKTIEEETGKPVDSTFSEFDPVPLGSASIGQVHRARLKTNGKVVAVKVQYPEAQELFQEDMHTIRSFCELLAPEHVVVLSALEKQNEAELDYRNEAQNLLEVHSNMQKHGFLPREVVVPLPLPELTTSRILVMDLIEGPKLVDGIRAYFAKYAEQHGTTLHDLEEEMRDKIEREGIPAKYDGPSAWKIALYRKSLVVWDRLINCGVGIFNGFVGTFISKDRKLPYQQSTLPPNIPQIIDTLMRVHGYQLMKDGTFNSDPHGGNFILMKDGRIGLIDYGATKRLDENERQSACLLFAALARRDEQKLFDMCEIGGYKSKYNKRDVLMKLLLFGYDSWGKDVTGGMNIQQFIDKLKKEDPWEEVPDNFVMAQFMSIRLRSLALGMNHPVKCSDWWGPMAEAFLEEEGHPYNSWDYDKMMANKPKLNMQKYKFA